MTKRVFDAFSSLRPDSTAKDYAHFCALSGRVNLDARSAVDIEKKRDAFDIQVKAALLLARRVCRERKMSYGSSTRPIDPLLVYEKLIQMKRADAPTVLASILAPALRPGAGPGDDHADYLSRMKPIFDEVRNTFGAEVLQLVTNTLQIRELHYLPSYQDYAKFQPPDLNEAEKVREAGFQGMLMETVKDTRAVFIRLAVRLVFLETYTAKLSVAERATEIQRNRSIYIPFAHNINARRELDALEEYNIRYEKPGDYEYIVNAIQTAEDSILKEAGKEKLQNRNSRKALSLKAVEERIMQAIPEDLLPLCRIEKRRKSVGSLARAMEKKGRDLDLTDIYAFRVIVRSMKEEADVMRVFHRSQGHLKRGPKEKNFYANPKPNGFQAIIANFYFDLEPEKEKATKEVKKCKTDPGKVAQAQEAEKEGLPKGAKEETNKTEKKKKKKEQAAAFDGNPALLFEVQYVGEQQHAFNERTHGSYKGAFQLAAGALTTVSVFTPNGHIHQLPRGASAADLAARISPELAFSINADSLTVRRSDPFMPLEDNLLSSPLQPGDYVAFYPDYPAGRYRSNARIYDSQNRRAVIEACRTGAYRAKLKRFLDRIAPGPSQT